MRAAVAEPLHAAGRGLQTPLGPPIEPRPGLSMREAVQQRLRDAIQTVRLLPGQAIPENEIVQMLQVSRTPVREALQRLANEGLVHVVPQIGTFVARMDLARIREALFVREAIECAALERLPDPPVMSDVQALERVVAEHRRAVRATDMTATLAADDAFHRRLLEMAGVPGVWRHVREAREMHRRVRILARQVGAPRQSVLQHATVVEYLAAGHRHRAAEALRAHIRMNGALALDIATAHPEYFTRMQAADER